MHLQYLCMFVPANKRLSPNEMDMRPHCMSIAFLVSEAEWSAHPLPPTHTHPLQHLFTSPCPPFCFSHSTTTASAPALGARGITQSNWITNPVGQRKPWGSGWMNSSALSCDVCWWMVRAQKTSGQVQSLHDGLWVCCSFSRKWDISRDIPSRNCHWLLRSFGENLSLFPHKLSSRFHTFRYFNARCFPQSYLPLFTPALFGPSFLHLLWVGLCPLTSLLACFPWLSTAVALSAKPLFSSTLLYKLAGCLSHAPALLMRADVSGPCLFPDQRAGSPSSFDSGHSTSTRIRAFLCTRLLVHAAVMHAH